MGSLQNFRPLFRKRLSIAATQSVTLCEALVELQRAIHEFAMSLISWTRSKFIWTSPPSTGYVHMNIKTYFRRLWARLRHKFTHES